MFLLALIFVFVAIGALIGGFQDKRSVLPAVAVGVLAGALNAWVAARLLSQADAMTIVVSAVAGLLAPMLATLLGHWLVARMRWPEA
ncbi:MAG: hypothetical protein J0L81_06145 [Caulobacterales bacterium]|jgi:hypothetical protein|nr:hypothetical protein [Caulobacterales bacterium]